MSVLPLYVKKSGLHDDHESPARNSELTFRIRDLNKLLANTRSIRC